MIVRNIRHTESGSERRLEAEVLFEKEAVTENYLIQYSNQENTSIDQTESCIGDVFLVALMLPAMAVGERLRIESPVSEDVAAALLNNTVPLMLKWFPRLHAIENELELETKPVAQSHRTATLFSCGVDSWHTLVGCHERIDTLIHIRGFEMPLDNSEIWKRANLTVREVASVYRKSLINVETNFGEATRRRVGHNPEVDWDDFECDAYFGHLLCAVGFALRAQLGTLIIPSSYTEGVEKVASHPTLEPQLSVDSLALEIHGFECNRIQKMTDIAKLDPDFIERFRVCVDPDFEGANQIINCGTCLKCLRAKLELRLCGITYGPELFATPLNMTDYTCSKPRGSKSLWQFVADEAVRQEDLEVQKAVTTMLTQPGLVRKARRLKRKIDKRLNSRKKL